MRSASTLASLLTLLAAGAALTTLLEPRPRARVELLTRASRLAPSDGARWTVRTGRDAAFSDVEVAQERRRALKLHAPGAWSTPVHVPRDARLRLAFDVDPPGARVSLLVRLQRDRGSELLLRAPAPGKRGWREIELDLARFAGERAELELALVGDPAAVSISAPTLVTPAAPGRAPHVLVYLIDCLRADHVGAYGYARPTTPHLDALARDGVVFEQAWSCASWTKPSVGCLLTGLSGLRHGARTLDDSLDPRVTTLAEAFDRAGYASAAFVDNPFVSSRAFGLTRGFEQVRQVVAAPTRRNINSLEGDALKLQRALAPWLVAHAGTRFLLYAHSIDLHAEYRPRPPFTRLFTQPGVTPRDVDLYDAELRANDEAFGKLLALLKQLGLYESTLIVVTADHGEEFGEQGAWRHGHTLNQGLLHVPLIVKLAGRAPAARRVTTPVSSVDLLPTLLDLAGLPLPAGVEGHSLRDLLEGRAAEARTIFAEQLSPKEVLYAARDERYKAVQQLLPRLMRRLIDLRHDPHEMVDLSASPPVGARVLLRRLDAWIAGGQAGWHVALAALEPPGEMTLEAETDARIVDVQRFPVEQGEALELADDGRRLSYRFRAGAQARHVVLRSEPADAPLRLRLLRAGRPLPLFDIGLGAARERPAAQPILLDAGREVVPAAQILALLETRSPAMRIWHAVARASDPHARLDPALHESLRALGYVQ